MVKVKLLSICWELFYTYCWVKVFHLNPQNPELFFLYEEKNSKFLSKKVKRRKQNPKFQKNTILLRLKAPVWPVWPDGQIVFSIFGHLQRWKFAQKHTKSPKVGSQLCQISNKPFKCWQRFLKFLLNRRNFAKSGHTTAGKINFLTEKCS